MTTRINRILNRIVKTILPGLLLLAVVSPGLAAGPATAKPPTGGLAEYRQQRPGMDGLPLAKESGAATLPATFYADHKSTFWFFIAVICILCAAIAVLAVNIAARRKADKELKKEKEYIEQIIAIAPTMICSIAADGRTLSSNKAVYYVSGYSIRALEGRNWWRTFSNKTPQQIHQLLDELKQGPVLGHEMTLTTKTGEKRIVSWNLVAKVREDGGCLEIIGVGADVTERKQAEEERELFLRELESMNKELESIVYVASHDLRSPLVNIQGFSRKLGKACDEINDLVAHSQIPDDLQLALNAIKATVAKSLHFITSSVEKMDSLLGGLLRLSRLGRKALKHEKIDMDQLICDVVASMTYQVQKSKGAVEVEPLLPCLGDPVQINQVFSNLVDNAIKYAAPERPLRIGISSWRDGSQAVFRITDNGIGIPSSQQEKIWEIFHRLNPGHDVEGEGLGLTVVRRILDRSNGKVWVESESGVGSNFFVSLPHADADEA